MAKKAGKKTKRPKQSLADGIAIGLADAFEKWDAAQARADEQAYSERWHRKPTLTEDDWREAVNRQLDALSAAQDANNAKFRVAMLTLMGTASATRRMSDASRETLGMVVQHLDRTIGIIERLSQKLQAMDVRTGHVKPPKKWRVDIDKLLARLMVLGRLMSTVETIFGDEHKRLPPSP